jgi:cytochrome c oxidase assembly protein subunit 11
MADLRRRNTRTVLSLVVVLGAMGALVVNSVSLYELFCQVTGFGGATRRADAAPARTADRVITIRFEGNVNPRLPWRFYPLAREIKVRVGERSLAHYVAKNVGGRALTGVASFNVTPAKAGPYFNKIACFCFNEQRLASGQVAQMPVSFFVDPAILKDRNLDDVEVITLSYTFFKSAKSADAGRPVRGPASPVID